MHLVVGLRNPGREYLGTRHNVGGEVVELVASRHDAGFRRAPRAVPAEVSEIRVGERRVALALPSVFMNESGRAVGPLVHWYKVSLDEMLVVHDDIDLPFGKLRIQFDRGAGGHNGVRSVSGTVGNGYWRLKVGVGRPPARMDPADYVLARFRAAERPVVDRVVADAADLVELFVAEGGDAARQRAGELDPGGAE